MKKMPFISMILAVALSLTACESGQRGQKETVGAGAGAIAGGILGAQFGSGSGRLWATGAGVLLGAYAGSNIGRQLDEADRAKHNAASQRAHSAPVGETISWDNPNSGHSGSVTPIRSGTNTSGQTCREYKQTIVVDGKSETAYGTACQQTDGSWRLVQ